MVVLFSFLVGCASRPPATTDYDPSENVTTYESRSISLSGLQIGSSSLSSGTEVSIQALGQCKGADCRPDEVALIFRASGSNDLRIDNPSVELTAGKLTVKSTSPDRDKNLRFREIDKISGEVTRIGLSFEEFRHFAEAEELSGSLADSRFTLSQNRTQPFRTLIRRAGGSGE